MFTGTVVLGVGVLIGMRGKNLFSYIVSIVGGIACFLGLLLLVTICGGTDTELGLYITLAFSLIAGGAASTFFWKTRRWSIELLGIVTGLFVSTLIYTIIALTTGFGP